MGRRGLEVQAAGHSSLLRKPVQDVSWALPHIFSGPLGCHCGLFCTGFDPVCTDSAPPHNETCCSLSLLPPTSLWPLPEVPVGAYRPRVVGNPWMWGGLSFPSGVRSHCTLASPFTSDHPLLQTILRLTIYSSEVFSGLEHPS